MLASLFSSSLISQSRLIISSKPYLHKPFYYSTASVKFHHPYKVAAATYSTYNSTTTSTTAPEMASTASASSFYEVLGIPACASGSEIKAAYRRLARTCHPDMVSMNQKEISANEFIKIHSAYSTLSDPDKRTNYDRDLFLRSKRSVGSSTTASSISRFSGYKTTRNWETDQCW